VEADLAPLVLETALWGAASPSDLTWITPPPSGALKQAAALLEALDLIDSQGRITASGRQAAAMGLHPRLGRMVRKAKERGWLATAAVTAAILEEGDPLGRDDPDFRDRLSAWALGQAEGGGSRQDAGRRIAREAERTITDSRLGRADYSRLRCRSIAHGRLLIHAYPDRAASVSEATACQRRAPVLVTGRPDKRALGRGIPRRCGLGWR
jgi:ATP-dependent helicase HrpB